MRLKTKIVLWLIKNLQYNNNHPFTEDNRFFVKLKIFFSFFLFTVHYK